MDELKHTLLICTVGGTPDPVVKALLHWTPARVLFVTSPETRSQVDTVLRAFAESAGTPFSPGQYEVRPVPDAEDLTLCVGAIREIEAIVTNWVSRTGGSYEVVVDFTAGTKCMTAALALVSQRWPGLYSYVGGARRTKLGVGIVETGAERVVHCANPWDSLGYQAVEDFVVLFDRLAFASAKELAERTKQRISVPWRKRELNALEFLAQAFDAWDRFDHNGCELALERCMGFSNDTKAALGDAVSQKLIDALPRIAEHVSAVRAATPPSRHHVIDLLANARRRRLEGRADDAVARLYRAIEAIAQLALKESHGIESTEKVPIDRVPDSLRIRWEHRCSEGVLSLGLQDAYVLLAGLNDRLGEKFCELKLAGPRSPLNERNRSILAHGFRKVETKVFDKLWSAALALADLEESDLPSMPTLGSRPSHAG